MLKALLLLLLAAVPAAAQTGDDFSFFQTEEKFSTASRTPIRASRSPAAVFTVTAEDIQASGATTVWDVLRRVPGVDVATARTGQGAVSLRGFNSASNNRTLILLDGRTVLDGFNDAMMWESLPVALDEIERIEVVPGPASALYGANALNGVVNIITKSPERLKGGLVRVRGGERSFSSANALYGTKRGPYAYKLSAAHNYSNRFSDGGLLASRAGKFHAFLSRDLGDESNVAVSGGFSDFRTQTGADSISDGVSSFWRADYRRAGTRLRAFGNRGRRAVESSSLNTTQDYDTYDASAEQSLEPHESNSLVLGLSYRRNSARSTVFEPGLRTQDLAAVYLEDQWRPHEDWTLFTGARVDKHPFIPPMFSPRGSLLWHPSERHTVRAGASSAFRAPTLLENYLETDLIIPANPPGLPVPVRLISTHNQGLNPERIVHYELGHESRHGRCTTHQELFLYKIKDLVAGTVVIGAGNPLPVTLNVVNNGETTGMGGEAGAEFFVTRGLSTFANYSYVSLKNSTPDQTTARSVPKHKGSAGARWQKDGLTAGLWAHVVDQTYWKQNAGLSTAVNYAKVPAYVLLNGQALYAFSGRAEGLEAGVGVFNLLQREHYEMLPDAGGEIIRWRWTGTVSYRF